MYIIGRRVHHGLSGCILTILGCGLLIHDRKDWKRWLADLYKEF